MYNLINISSLTLVNGIVVFEALNQVIPRGTEMCLAHDAELNLYADRS